MTLLRKFYTLSVDMGPEILRMEDCESLVAHRRGKATVTEKCLVRHPLGLQQVPDDGDLGNAFLSPGAGHPAGRLADVKRDLVHFLRMSQSVSPCSSAIWR